MSVQAIALRQWKMDYHQEQRMKTDVGRRMSGHALMKRKNQLTILEQIQSAGPITRVRLKKETRLSWGTITLSTKELLSKGIIKEARSVATGIGRHPVELDLNEKKNLVLGLRLGSILIRGVLVNVKGVIVDELEIPVDASGSAQRILEALLGAGRQIMRKNSINTKSLAGIGIAAPGAVDFSSGVCHWAPHHPRWKEVPLKTKFEEAFRVPCFVDHTYNCFVLCEKLFGLGRGLENFVGVLLGTGVSAGLIIHGEVYRGADCSAGEFGHTNVDPEGLPCACGKNGCIEAYISGPAIAQSASRCISRKSGGILRSLVHGDLARVRAEDVERAARQGDALALDIFSRMGCVLGIGLSNIVNILNPQVIILGGEVANASEFFLPSCLEKLSNSAWQASSKEVRVSQLRNGASLGAAALVLDQLFSTGRILQRRG